jgi:hypothetical protein
MPMLGVIMAKSLLLLALAVSLTACATSGLNGSLTTGEKFGVAIGGEATGAQNALWAEGYGYLGSARRDGETVLRFQPVALDRKGIVTLTVRDGRITAIAWDLKIVPVLEG